MSSFYSYLVSLGAWNWFIVALVLFVLEAIVPGAHFLWFALAAVVVGALALLTGVTWVWQVIAFAIFAVGSVFIVRRFVRPGTNLTDEPDLNIRGKQYVGRTVIVEDVIANGRGRVRIGDTIWQAEGPDAAKGARMRVHSVRDTVLVVEHEKV